MNPQKVDRTRTAKLEDLPNIGKACAADLRQIGIHRPAQLCLATGTRHDPCMIDVFMSIVAFRTAAIRSLGGRLPRRVNAVTGRNGINQKLRMAQIRIYGIHAQRRNPFEPQN